MQLKPEEISKIIRAQIKHYENAIEQSETGTVIMVGDGIARASGLEKCMAGELLQFENGEYGMAQNLEENTVSIVLLGSDVGIKEGSTVKRTGKVVSVPVGEAMIGRVVNALGRIPYEKWLKFVWKLMLLFLLLTGLLLVLAAALS